MTTNVIRSARVLGGFLGPPFVDNIDHRQQMWTSPELTAACRDGEHAAPAPGCQCGVWAAVSQGAYQRFLRTYREDRTRHLQYLGDAYRSLPPEEYKRASGKARAEAEQIRGWLAETPHGINWALHAVVGCRTLDEVSQPLVNPRPGWGPVAWHEAIALRQAVHECSREEALRWLLATEIPDGFRRYRRLLVTHIWISSACAEYADDLAERYDARVIQVPDRNGNWLDEFIRTGGLPGLSAPSGNPAHRVGPMTPTDLAVIEARAARAHG